MKASWQIDLDHTHMNSFKDWSDLQKLNIQDIRELVHVRATYNR